LGLLFGAQTEANAQCLQNGGLEYGIPTPGLDFPPSSSGGWYAQGGNLEIWGSGWNGIPAYEGSNFAELNVNAADIYYQDVATTAGQVYLWSIAHRGRDGTNTALIEFGPP